MMIIQMVPGEAASNVVTENQELRLQTHNINAVEA